MPRNDVNKKPGTLLTLSCRAPLLNYTSSYYPRHQLVARFRAQGERDMRRAIGRSARRGLLLERKDPKGRSFVAVSTEGWQALRNGDFEPRRLRIRED